MGSLPSLNEVEDILHMQRRNQDALIRIRTAVVNQEQALAEMAQRKAYKPEDEHMAGTMYQEDFKGVGGFAGADSKKRRGVSPDFSPWFLALDPFILCQSGLIRALMLHFSHVTNWVANHIFLF